jgi:hypothetical protein
MSIVKGESDGVGFNDSWQDYQNSQDRHDSKEMLEIGLHLCFSYGLLSGVWE